MQRAIAGQSGKQLGIDPIHFAAIMGVNLAMGGVTPPYASILYLGMRIGKCEFTEILGPTMIFLIFGYIPIVFLTTYWPDLSLFLPNLALLALSPREERWGWVVGAFTLSYALFEIPSGALGDRLGQRKLLTRIVLWWSAFTAITGVIGMQGVGQIFQWYRSGKIEAEDEVALVFDPKTFKPISEPLVNMRYAFAPGTPAWAQI